MHTIRTLKQFHSTCYIVVVVDVDVWMFLCRLSMNSFARFIFFLLFILTIEHTHTLTYIKRKKISSSAFIFILHDGNDGCDGFF